MFCTALKTCGKEEALSKFFSRLPASPWMKRAPFHLCKRDMFRQTLYLFVKTATSDNNTIWNTQAHGRLRSDRWGSSCSETSITVTYPFEMRFHQFSDLQIGFFWTNTTNYVRVFGDLGKIFKAIHTLVTNQPTTRGQQRIWKYCFPQGCYFILNTDFKIKPGNFFEKFARSCKNSNFLKVDCHYFVLFFLHIICNESVSDIKHK